MTKKIIMAAVLSVFSLHAMSGKHTSQFYNQEADNNTQLRNLGAQDIEGENKKKRGPKKGKKGGVKNKGEKGKIGKGKKGKGKKNNKKKQNPEAVQQI